MTIEILREKCVLVPMRDGTLLACEIWRPTQAQSCAGLVFRTPYGRGNDLGAYVEAGFCAIIADARGTGASQGSYDYYNLDAGRYDGYDLIEWLAQQEWCNGRIAAVGGSALGIYAIAAAAENPPHLACLVLDVVPADFYAHQWYPGGVLRSDSRFGWCLGTANRCAPGAVWDEEAMNDTVQRPYKAAVQAQRFASKSTDPLAWARPYFEQRERDDLWAGIDLTPKLAAIKQPILFGGVFYDHFGKGTVAAHAAHQGPKHLSMQGGSVSDPLEAGGWDIPWDDRIAWLRFYLCEEGSCPAGGEHWYLTGAEQRIAFADKPSITWPTTAIAAPLALQHNPEQPSLSSLAPDPLQFTPFIEQADVHVIDIDCAAAGLCADATILGHPRLRFKVQASHKDAQVLVRFCILRADGETRMLNIGARRLFLDDDMQTVIDFNDQERASSLEFWTIGHQLQPQEKIRLVVSTSDSPFWESPSAAFQVTLTDLHLELPLLTGEYNIV